MSSLKLQETIQCSTNNTEAKVIKVTSQEMEEEEDKVPPVFVVVKRDISALLVPLSMKKQSAPTRPAKTLCGILSKPAI